MSDAAMAADLELLGRHNVPAGDLLGFYRKRLSAFDGERQDCLQRLADVEAQNVELHRLRWELRSRDAEVRELQGALSSSKLYLYDEREVALKLAAENDALKAGEVEDRRRIAHLLALTEPMTQERQVSEIQALADERAAALARSRLEAMDVAQARASSDAATIRTLEQHVETLQAKLTHLTRDYLKQRLVLTNAETVAKEAASIAIAAKAEAEAEATRVCVAAEADARASQAAAEAQAKALSGALTARAQQFDDASRLLTVQAAADKVALTDKVDKLQSALAREKARNASLEARRAMDLEGTQRDITTLRRALRQLETQWAAWALEGGGGGEGSGGGGPAPHSAASALAEASASVRADEALLRASRGQGVAPGVAAAAWEQGHLEGGVGADFYPSAYLPSRAATIPPLVTRTRSGGVSAAPPDARDVGVQPRARLSAARNTMAGYDAVDFAARELAEVERRGGGGGADAGGGRQGAARGGARRVPVGSPSAAPRFDAPTPTHTATRAEEDAPAPLPPASARAAAVESRGRAIEAQLAELRERIGELDMRASRLGGQ